MSEREKMVAGQIYNPADPELSALSRQAKHRAYMLNQTDPSDEGLYMRRLKELLPGLGEGSYLAPGVQVDYGIHVKTGKNFYMNYGAVLLDVCPIEIGDDVMCGVGVHIVTPLHPLLAEERVTHHFPDGDHDLEYAKPIKIGSNVWLASDVTVCGGVSIGDNSVIAAGAVVTKDIPSGVLAGGVPCKAIRPLNENDRLGVYGKK